MLNDREEKKKKSLQDKIERLRDVIKNNKDEDLQIKNFRERNIKKRRECMYRIRGRRRPRNEARPISPLIGWSRI